MRTADHAARRAPSSARWMALEGALCALLLAIGVGVCSMSARALGHTDTRRVTTVRERQRENSLSAHVFGPQRLVGVHAAPSQGHLELPRPGGKPPPLHQRSDTRLNPALRPEALLAERTRMRLSCVSPTSHHGRVADRPVIANCPAQGPPRTA
ncbi:hypothetical protein [Archangium lansingense]|uniref:Lipoprotein n=1 Tax=Archangium lansingense TaxID=2995310 RepID=A0ABT3ZZZ6_9BACT|nr:hypothetical protein [Archangium lansinium]MCY1074973.1 hypothetical protein [Archangium lansinium]